MFSEYDLEAYSNSYKSTTVNDIVRLKDNPYQFIANNDTITRLITAKDSNISLYIKYIPSVLKDFEGMNFPHQPGYVMVIKPENYIYDIPATLIEKDNYQYVLKQGNQIKVASTYDALNNIWLTFGYSGANALFSLKEIRLSTHESYLVSKNINRNSYTILPEISHWLDPYKVRAKNNPLNKNSSFFTGGNHNELI